MSLANIAVPHIVESVATTLNEAEFFKGLIDDIIWVSYGKDLTTKIESNQPVTDLSKIYGLQLKFRMVNTDDIGNKLEYSWTYNTSSQLKLNLALLLQIIPNSPLEAFVS